MKPLIKPNPAPSDRRKMLEPISAAEKDLAA